MKDRALATVDLDALKAELKKGLDLYRKGGSNSEKAGSLEQIYVVMNLLETWFTGEDARLIEPIRHLFTALLDLDRDARDSILEPARELQNRPKLSTQDSRPRAHAAALMHMLMMKGGLGGLGKEAAARTVARKLGLSASAKDVVRYWRDQAMAGDPEKDPLAYRFRIVTTALQAMFPGEPRRAAEYLLSRIRP
jgi:hypothetical protein